MFAGALALLISVSSFGADHITCDNPPPRTCSFYRDCLEATSPCGKNGYALSYGDKYCTRFLADSRLSANGLQWRDATLLCLQLALVPAAEFQLSCEDVTDIGFSSHPGCYLQNGERSICDLGVRDLRIIYFKVDVSDRWSKRGRKQMKSVAKVCIKSLKRELDEARKKTTVPGQVADLEDRIEFWEEID